MLKAEIIVMKVLTSVNWSNTTARPHHCVIVVVSIKDAELRFVGKREGGVLHHDATLAFAAHHLKGAFHNPLKTRPVE